jgi:hypothetical protein
MGKAKTGYPLEIRVIDIMGEFAHWVCMLSLVS